MKLNDKNMVQKFEKSKWYDIDMILDWDKRKVCIYVNGVAKPKSTDDFFTNAKKLKNKTGKEEIWANAISIYGLSPDG